MHKGLYGIPALKAAVLTKSDTTVYTPAYHGLYVGGAGDVTVIPEGQSATVTFTSVPTGTILPVTVKQLMSTGTTATNIVGLF